MNLPISNHPEILASFRADAIASLNAVTTLYDRQTAGSPVAIKESKTNKKLIY